MHFIGGEQIFVDLWLKQKSADVRNQRNVNMFFIYWDIDNINNNNNRITLHFDITLHFVF